MSVPARLLALPGALLLLAGCRHKPAPAVKPAPNSAPTSTAARPPIEADPLAQLRPHLAEALSKVRAAAGPMGLLGWPGVATVEGPDESDPSLERRFFHNDRALIFVDKTHDRYSALVLMPESKSTDELHYWPVWVRDLFGSPSLEPARLPSKDMEGFGSSEGIEWRGSETIIQDQYPPESALRLHPEEPFLLLTGQRDSDDIAYFLADTTPQLRFWIQEVADDQGNLEGQHDLMDAEFAQILKRSELQAAVKRGESKRFVWFDVDGKPYAAEKSAWDLWMKGSRPAVIKDQSNP